MADLYIRYATVEKVFQTDEGWGTRIAEPFTRNDGTPGMKFYTAWSDAQPNVMEGSKVSAKGRLGVSIGERRNGTPYANLVLHDSVLAEPVPDGATSPRAGLSDPGWVLPPAKRQEAF